mgnify:CR=1 FL=1
MGQKGFYFDQTRCTGCRTCSVACSDLHNYAPDIVLRRVIEFEGGTWKVNTNGTCTQNVFAYYTSIGCNECENPVCVKACPTGAHHKRTEDGLVVIDTEKCIGCGMCAVAVPEVFRVVEHVSTVLALPEPGRIFRVLDAANGCPVNAIQIKRD